MPPARSSPGTALLADLPPLPPPVSFEGLPPISAPAPVLAPPRVPELPPALPVPEPIIGPEPPPPPLPTELLPTGARMRRAGTPYYEGVRKIFGGELGAGIAARLWPEDYQAQEAESQRFREGLWSVPTGTADLPVVGKVGLPFAGEPLQHLAMGAAGYLAAGHLWPLHHGMQETGRVLQNPDVPVPQAIAHGATQGIGAALMGKGLGAIHKALTYPKAATEFAQKFPGMPMPEGVRPVRMLEAWGEKLGITKPSAPPSLRLRGPLERDIIKEAKALAEGTGSIKRYDALRAEWVQVVRRSFPREDAAQLALRLGERIQATQELVARTPPKLPTVESLLTEARAAGKSFPLRPLTYSQARWWRHLTPVERQQWLKDNFVGTDVASRLRAASVKRQLAFLERLWEAGGESFEWSGMRVPVAKAPAVPGVSPGLPLFSSVIPPLPRLALWKEMARDVGKMVPKVASKFATWASMYSGEGADFGKAAALVFAKEGITGPLAEAIRDAVAGRQAGGPGEGVSAPPPATAPESGAWIGLPTVPKDEMALHNLLVGARQTGNRMTLREISTTHVIQSGKATLAEAVAYLQKNGVDIPDAAAEAPVTPPAAKEAPEAPAATPVATEKPVKATPKAIQRAKEAGVDISGIKGTGYGGRVRVVDVDAVAAEAGPPAPPAAEKQPAAGAGEGAQNALTAAKQAAILEVEEVSKAGYDEPVFVTRRFGGAGRTPTFRSREDAIDFAYRRILNQRGRQSQYVGDIREVSLGSLEGAMPQVVAAKANMPLLMDIADGKQQMATVGDILTDPYMRKLYGPVLGLPVRTLPQGSLVKGVEYYADYSEGGKEIRIGRDPDRPDAFALKALLHEAAHAMRDLKGRALEGYAGILPEQIGNVRTEELANKMANHAWAYIPKPALAARAAEPAPEAPGLRRAPAKPPAAAAPAPPAAEKQPWEMTTKVVDERGTPRVLYHGTQAQFAAFDPALAGSATGAKSAHLGIFFTDSPHVAERFFAKGKEGRVITANLDIRNPLELFATPLQYRTTAMGTRVPISVPYSRGVLRTKEGYLVDTSEVAKVGDAHEQLKRAVANMAGKDIGELVADDYKRWVQKVRAGGYDGIRLQNAMMDMDGQTHDVWIAFNASQVHELQGEPRADAALAQAEGAEAAVTPPAEAAEALAPPAAEKQPWEMTQYDYAVSKAKAKATGVPGMQKWYSGEQKRLYRQHQRAVKKALAEGKAIPPEVLADYPDLAKAAPVPSATLSEAVTYVEPRIQKVESEFHAGGPGLTQGQQKRIDGILNRAAKRFGVDTEDLRAASMWLPAEERMKGERGPPMTKAEVAKFQKEARALSELPQAPVPPVREETPAQVAQRWADAEYKPDLGSWDLNAIKSQQEKLGRLAADVLARPWQPTRGYLGRKKATGANIRAVADTLEELVTLGWAQVAWDSEGNPHWAKVGRPVSANLTQAPAPPEAPAPPAAEKQPWEMTQYDYAVSKAKAKATGVPGMQKWYSGEQKRLYRQHQRAVKKALAEGKAIPPEVLADYPDLAPAAEPPAVAAAEKLVKAKETEVVAEREKGKAEVAEVKEKVSKVQRTALERYRQFQTDIADARKAVGEAARAERTVQSNRHLLHEQARQKILAILKGLPAKQARVFRTKYYHGISEPGVAEKVSIDRLTHALNRAEALKTQDLLTQAAEAAVRKITKLSRSLREMTDDLGEQAQAVIEGVGHITITAMKQRGFEGIEAVVRQAETILYQHQRAAEARVLGKIMASEKLAAGLLGELGTVPPMKIPTHGGLEYDPKLGPLSWFWGPGVEKMRTTCQKIGGRKGLFGQVFVRSLDKSRRTNLANYRQAHEHLESALKAMGLEFGKGAVLRWSAATSSTPMTVTYNLPTMGKLTLTKAEALSLYNLARQPYVRAQVEAKMEMDRKLQGFVSSRRRAGTPSRATVADLDVIVDQTPKDVRTLGDALREFLNQPEYKAALDAAYFEQTGRHLKMEEDYWPVWINATYDRWHHEPQNIQELVERMVESLGSLKERIGTGSQSIVIADGFSAFLGSAWDTSHYIGFADHLRTAWMMLGRPDIRTEIANRCGAQMVEAFKDHLRFVSGMGHLALDEPEKFLSRMVSGFTTSIMAANPDITVVQPLSYPLAVEVIGRDSFTEGMKRLLAGARAMVSPEKFRAARDRMLAHSPEAWYRFRIAHAEQLVNPSISARHPLKGLRRYMEKLAWARHTDYWTHVGLWQAAEDTISETRPDLKVESDAWWEAVDELFTDMMNDTQPSFSPVHQSGIARMGRRKPVWRVLTVFTNIRNTMVNIAKREYDDFRRVSWDNHPVKMKALGRLMAVVVGVIGVGSMAGYVALRRGTKRIWRGGKADPKYGALTFAADTVGQTLGTVYFLGEGYDAVRWGLRKGGSYDTALRANPAEAIVEGYLKGIVDLMLSVEQAVSGEKYKAGRYRGQGKAPRTALRAAGNLFEAALMTTGLPVKPYYIGRMFLRSLEEEAPAAPGKAPAGDIDALVRKASGTGSGAAVAVAELKKRGVTLAQARLAVRRLTKGADRRKRLWALNALWHKTRTTLERTIA